MFKSDDQNLVNNSSAMPLLESMSSNVVNAESKQDQNHQNHIRIAPKFPPTVDMIELISKKSPDGRIPARAPNAFIIYRKVYVETARENGHYLPMTIVSSMASQSWESADETVKAEYRRIAKEALRVRNEMYPKSGRRKRKDRWNIVSFDPPAPPLNKNERRRKNKNLKNNTKSIKEIKDNKNIEFRDTSPIILDPFSHSINSTPPSFNMYSNAAPNNLSNPDSALLYEMYLSDTDFNANNAFNDQSPISTSINTPPSSNVFTVPSYQDISFRQFDFGCELSELNLFTQEPTFLNNVNDLNLQIFNNSSHNDNVISSFEINQITENTPFMQSNNYDMMQPLQFHTDNFNIINSNVDCDIYGLCYNDTMPYPHA